MEDGIEALLGNAQQSITRTYNDLEDHVRKTPTSAMLAALVTGYCLHRLPVRAVVVANVRLLTALAVPTFFMLGAARAYEFLRSQAAAQ